MKKKKKAPNKDAETEFPVKMRIQLLENNGTLLSDRLVGQDLELKSGPKEQHTGPFRIEFIANSQEDITNLKNWMDKLSGILPIEKVKKGPKKGKLKLESPEHIKETLESITATYKNEGDLIRALRDQGFVFRSSEFLKLFNIAEVQDKHQSYSWMVKAIKLAKNPKADKYDPQLLFGFKLSKTGGSGHVRVYMYKKPYTVLNIDPAQGKAINYTKKELLVFPTYMREDERARFSIEHRKFKMNPDAKTSKFYDRWKDDVKFR